MDAAEHLRELHVLLGPKLGTCYIIDVKTNFKMIKTLIG